jgi:cysteine desulfurase
VKERDAGTSSLIPQQGHVQTRPVSTIMKPIFFDSQSSTPLLLEAQEAMLPWFQGQFGSPSSLHQYGLEAREALDQSRESFARMIHAEAPHNILFTSSGSEASNLAVKGAALASKKRGSHIVLSEIEHPAVTGSVDFLEDLGFSCTKLKVDREGFVDPDEAARAITNETILICAHLSNYDIATIQPVKQIASVAGEKGIPLFVDATYSGGWIPIDVQEMGIDLLSLAPARFYGPKGVGVLYRHRRTALASLIHGGNQEQGLRAGLENVPGIVGAGVAARVAREELSHRAAHTGRLQEMLWSELAGRIASVHLNGPLPGPQRAPNSLNVSFEFVEGEGVLLALDMKGIAVASGTSCLGKSLKVSPVLKAIGAEHRLAQGSVLLSLGKDNEEEEIPLFLEAMEKVVERLRSMSPSWEEFQQLHGLPQTST